MSALRWESNALTSTVHLVRDGVPLCKPRDIILAGEDEGGVACGHCFRIAAGHLPIPVRRRPR